MSWLVKPGGERFFSFGVCVVDMGASREDFSPTNPGYAAFQHYENSNRWGEATLKRLKTWNFTTVGGWSDYAALKRDREADVAFTPVLAVGMTAGVPWWDMWDTNIIARMHQIARDQILPLRDDPRLLGYYSDSEMGWWNAALFKMTLEHTCNFPTISGGNNQGPGSGRFITFTLDSPVVLNPNTTYGFDGGGGSTRHYWETDGRSCTPSGPNCNAVDPYVNGTAYSSGSGGSGTATMTNRSGDRVFVVALTPANVVVPPKITIQPKSLAYYAGKTAQFTAKASGSPTLLYQWKKNGTNLNNGGNISGALTDSLNINNLSAADAGAYSLSVTNDGGSTNSLAATLTVVPAPAPSANYVYHIYTNNALAHWRLSEAVDPSTNPPAYDYIGGRIGVYENASQKANGPQPAPFPGFESTNTAIQDHWQSRFGLGDGARVES
jgi:hypothetical protein